MHRPMNAQTFDRYLQQSHHNAKHSGDQDLICSSSQNQSFPLKLYCMLEDSAANGTEWIVSWLPGGRAFKVHQRDEFMDQICPLYFNQSKFKSFQRQLLLYGFEKKISLDLHLKGSYSHQHFLRGDKDMTSTIRRRPRDSKRQSGPISDYLKQKQTQTQTSQSGSAKAPESSHEADGSESTAPSGPHAKKTRFERLMERRLKSSMFSSTAYKKAMQGFCSSDLNSANLPIAPISNALAPSHAASFSSRPPTFDGRNHSFVNQDPVWHDADHASIATRSTDIVGDQNDDGGNSRGLSSSPCHSPPSLSPQLPSQMPPYSCNEANMNLATISAHLPSQSLNTPPATDTCYSGDWLSKFERVFDATPNPSSGLDMLSPIPLSDVSASQCTKVPDAQLSSSQPLDKTCFDDTLFNNTSR
eukprot:CAMPEP_0198112398 /NCGR_PEP_ID=MMETSP1442-20131203/4255_1 /TAXON_ID= /ORGANISM="Craspedostauros australis, Strain CCMP3328" /LENGTH=414 /DNA_ID=CAMNT_0043769147 /DNA_START=782 /DNA_END=2026 /DNA_ORIENTATION=+